MNAASSEPSMEHQSATMRPPKRLLFDRRYGWIFDEWKDPSEEALAGGRGMFCILPIAKSLLNIASQSIEAAAESVNRVTKNTKHVSPEASSEEQRTWFHKLEHSGAAAANLKLK
ncbi:uncharacterized protein LOC109709992 [Ananas comosus]|uniref:Uncharacterized protein LOC109709992 n=1 Tax=Ananas comosus TaxID=4615 RepID=A0A199W197_ANACO|nr:uncharacterized protein LOC109709992 [Ananas comosus]OAY83237.1 hypothetical protein ACMD2_06591 [Ananas comosus]